MHSNFITPPDVIETILIIDADQEQISDCAEYCRYSKVPYNVYLYSNDMNDIGWLHSICSKADVVLQASGSTVRAIPPVIMFGPAETLKTPADYFKKKTKKSNGA